MATEEIKITISGKTFTLNVDSTKRELYHLAERTLNSAIVKFEKKSLDGLRPQDIVALAAFEFVISNINLRQQSEIGSTEYDALDAIDRRIEEYLNDLNIEKSNE